MRLRVTAEQLHEAGACREGVQIFRDIYGDVADVEWTLDEQLKLLRTPLRGYLGWAVGRGIVPLWSMFDADLTDADLSGADLTGAVLVRARLVNANLRYTDLRRANLGYADLHGADLTGALLTGANLHGADLDEADLTDAIGLTR